MVCQDLEVRRYQKGSEYLHTPYYGQTLLLGGTVVGLRVVQCPGGTADYLFFAFLLLGQNSPQTYQARSQGGSRGSNDPPPLIPEGPKDQQFKNRPTCIPSGFRSTLINFNISLVLVTTEKDA